MIKKILFPVDLSHQNTAAAFAPTVEKIAEEFGAEILLLSVMPGFGMPIVASYFPEELEQQARTEFQSQLDQFAREQMTSSPRTRVRQGSNWRKIVATADEEGIDLITIPHRARSKAEEVLLGSCAQKVAERANCSVLILK